MERAAELLTAVVVGYWPACAIAMHAMGIASAGRMAGTGAGRRKLLFGAGVCHLLLLIGLQFLLGTGPASITQHYATWFDLPDPGGISVTADFVVTPAAVSLMLLGTVCMLIACGGGLSGGDRQAVDARQSVWPMWWLAGLTLVACGENLVLVTAGCGIASAATVAMLAVAADARTFPMAARRLFILETCSLGLLVCAGVFSQIGLKSTSFAVWGDAEAIAGFRELNPALIGLTGLCLAGSVLIRLSCFPFFGMLNDLAGIPAATAMAGYSIGQALLGIVLLIRSLIVLIHAPEAIGMMAALGTLGALLSLYVALTRSTVTTLLVYCGSAQWLLIAAGLAAGVRQTATGGTSSGITSAYSAIYLLGLASAMLPRLPAAGTDDKAAPDSPGTSPIPRWVTATAGLTLLGLFPTSGVLAQTGLVSAIYDASTSHVASASADVTDTDIDTDTDTDTAVDVDPNRSMFQMAFLMACVAQVPAGLIAIRLLRGRHPEHGMTAGPPSMPPPPPPTPSLPTRVVAVFWGGLLLLPLALAVDPTQMLPNVLRNRFTLLQYGWSADAVPLAAVVAAQLLGIGLGYVFQRRFDGRLTVAEDRGTLRRLSRRLLYVDELTLFLISLPVRATAQLWRFADWIVVDMVFVTLPRRLSHGIAAASDRLQGESTAFYLAATLLSTAVLGLALLWSQG